MWGNSGRNHSEPVEEKSAGKKNDGKGFLLFGWMKVIGKEKLREGCGSLGDVMGSDSSGRTAKFSCHRISDLLWGNAAATFEKNGNAKTQRLFLAVCPSA